MREGDDRVDTETRNKLSIDHEDTKIRMAL
jgi:hypothetical protein